jgi:hypothetical protein
LDCRLVKGVCLHGHSPIMTLDYLGNGLDVWICRGRDPAGYNPAVLPGSSKSLARAVDRRGLDT